MIQWGTNKLVGVLFVISVLSGIGYFMYQATTKENTQTITVEPGGVATIHNEVKQERNNWSIGGYIETSIDIEDITVGVVVTRYF